MNKKVNFIMLAVLFVLTSCGFHLRGLDNDYQFPYKTILVDCDGITICDSFKNTIKVESLALMVESRESAEAVITLTDQNADRIVYNYNSVGQIASYKLIYQITARIYSKDDIQTAPDIKVSAQELLNYNNSLILSATQAEQDVWDRVHQSAVNTLVRRIVYSHPHLVSSKNAAESK